MEIKFDFSKTIAELRKLLPKSSISKEYVDIIYVAMGFASAEVSDTIKNLDNFQKDVDIEEMKKLFQSRFEFHIKNQMELFKQRK